MPNNVPNLHNEVKFTTDYIEQLTTLLTQLPTEQVAQLIQLFRDARDNDRNIFIVGNGGSATTATHFATDVGKGASLGQPRRFKIMSLNDNVGWMTALGNDLSYEDIFVEQLKNFATADDVVVAISVSGNSPNAVKAVEWAQANGCHTAALLGEPGGRLKDLANLPIVVPTNHFGRAEDAHLIITHIVGYFFMEAGHAGNLPHD